MEGCWHCCWWLRGPFSIRPWELGFERGEFDGKDNFREKERHGESVCFSVGVKMQMGELGVKNGGLTANGFEI